MKVLQVNKLYSPHIGGIERVIQDISEGLAPRYDVSVLVCQSKGKTSDDVINGIRVKRAGSIGTYFSMPVSFPFLHYFKKIHIFSDR
jgi:rhamnosyl/mannosyltransferase